MFDLEILIKEQEEKMGRPLTDKERQAIEGMAMILGALWNNETKHEEK